MNVPNSYGANLKLESTMVLVPMEVSDETPVSLTTFVRAPSHGFSLHDDALFPFGQKDLDGGFGKTAISVTFARAQDGNGSYVTKCSIK